MGATRSSSRRSRSRPTGSRRSGTPLVTGDPLVAIALAGRETARIELGTAVLQTYARTAERFGLRSIPTLLIFANGQEVDRIVGVQSKEEIARRLAQVMA